MNMYCAFALIFTLTLACSAHKETLESGDETGSAHAGTGDTTSRGAADTHDTGGVPGTGHNTDSGGDSGGDTGDLPGFPCDTLVTDYESKEVPDIDKPDYLEPLLDPVFGQRVIRIVGDPGDEIPVVGGTWGTIERHRYSVGPVWNADMSLMFLGKYNGDHDYLYLDAETYEPLFQRAAPSYVYEDRWHTTEPDLRVYVGTDGTVGTWNVWTGERTVIIDLSTEGYGDLYFGPGKGNVSHDGRWMAVRARHDGVLVCFALDLENAERHADIDLSGYDLPGSVYISALGNYIVFTHGMDEVTVFDRDGAQVQYWPEYHRPGHGDVTLDPDGQEVFVGGSKDDPDSGQVIARRLADGVVTPLTPPGPWVTHTSARNTQLDGWVFSSFDTDSALYAPYLNEVVMSPLNGSYAVARLAHTHQAETSNYWTETHASPSPNGRRVVFASNWGDTEGAIQAYVVEICEDQEPSKRTMSNRARLATRPAKE